MRLARGTGLGSSTPVLTTTCARIKSIGSSKNPVRCSYDSCTDRPLTLDKASIGAIERPFTPDGAKDLGGIWERQDGQVLPGSKRLAKPNALMFFHIPM